MGLYDEQRTKIDQDQQKCMVDFDSTIYDVAQELRTLGNNILSDIETGHLPRRREAIVEDLTTMISYLAGQCGHLHRLQHKYDQCDIDLFSMAINSVNDKLERIRKKEER